MPQVGTIPNPNITWTDGAGAGTLPATLAMLENWTPDAEDIGTTAVDLATGSTHKFIYRTDYTVTFDMTRLPSIEMALMLRLKRWLESGGPCIVNTQDVFQNSYQCRIKPKGKVTLRYDRKNIEYTLSLALLNTAAAPLLAQYKAQLGQFYTITIAPDPLILLAGGIAFPLTVAIVDGQNNTVVFPVVWQSSNPSVVQIDSVSGIVTPIAAGSAQISAAAGGTSDTINVTVTVDQTAASVTLSPSPIAFTATAYTGTPQLGVSGVPSKVVTAVVKNSSGVVLPYTPGMLAWSSDNVNVPVTDNGDGTATVGPPKAGGITNAHITCKVVLTPAATQTALVTTVPSVGVAVQPSQSSVTMTAVGQQDALTFVTITQYGENLP